MSTGQRTILVTIGVAVLGGVGLLARFLATEATGDAGGIELAGTAPGSQRSSTLRETTRAEPTPATTRTLAAANGKTSLEVNLVDEKGAPVTDAAIQLTSSEDSVVTGIGSMHWDEFPPGEWRLEVTAEKRINHYRSITVVEGRRNREIVQLPRKLEIRGSVTDVFGVPVAGLPVWFLREGENHPRMGEKLARRLGGITTNEGSFAVDLHVRGTYRVSVGRSGQPLATSDRRELYGGASQDVDIVVPGFTSVEAIVDHGGHDAPRGWKLELEVLRRRPDDDVDKRRHSPLVRQQAPPTRTGTPAQAPQTGPRSLIEGDVGVKKGGARKGTKSGAQEDARSGARKSDKNAAAKGDKKRTRAPGAVQESPGEPGGDAAGVAPNTAPKAGQSEKNRPEWLLLQTATPDDDGAVKLKRLPANEDLQFALRRRNDRLETTLPIVLAPDRRTRLRVALSARRTAQEIEANGVGPLSVFANVLPREPGDLDPGFYWK